MGRKSPIGEQGVGLSFRTSGQSARPNVAQFRVRDQRDEWIVKRFAVTQWKRDGTPVPPQDGIDWALRMKRDFLTNKAIAKPGTLADVTDGLIAILTSKGVQAERIALIRSVVDGLTKAGLDKPTKDGFGIRVQTWISSLQSCWSMDSTASNRHKKTKPLSAATKNKLLTVCRQLCHHGVHSGAWPQDPLHHIPSFKGEQRIREPFTVPELRQMVSDEARYHPKLFREALQARLPPVGTCSIEEIASECQVHPTTIYHWLRDGTEEDPWWLACCLLVYTGCRADEAMNLRWEWIHWQEQLIKLRLSNDYDNKSRKERLIPLEPELAEILAPLRQETGFILPPDIRAGGSGIIKHRMGHEEGTGAQDYAEALRRYLARIGFKARPGTTCQAHCLRHSYITIAVARPTGVNLVRLRKIVGHRSIKTTEGYAEMSQLFESEVATWPDQTMWLRRAVPSTMSA
jgi:integrase